MKHLAPAIALALGLSACASDENIARLNDYQRACALGHADACTLVPVQEKINHNEANTNALKALAIGVLLIPLAVLAGAAASQPDYVYVVGY